MGLNELGLGECWTGHKGGWRRQMSPKCVIYVYGIVE